MSTINVDKTSVKYKADFERHQIARKSEKEGRMAERGRGRGRERKRDHQIKKLLAKFRKSKHILYNTKRKQYYKGFRAICKKEKYGSHVNEDTKRIITSMLSSLEVQFWAL